MPWPVLWALRTVVEAMLTIVQRWEDKHLDPKHPDCRMTELNTGLWQASQSMGQILRGDEQPMLRQTRLRDLPQVYALGETYTRELLGEVPPPRPSAD